MCCRCCFEEGSCSDSSLQCCALCFYSILCFSAITACSYWNDQTLSAVAKYAVLIYQESLNDGNEFTCDYVPQGINIYGWKAVTGNQANNNTKHFTSWLIGINLHTS